MARMCRFHPVADAPLRRRTVPVTLLPVSAQPLLTEAMLIEQFDAKTDDDRLAACHQIVVSGHVVDDPNVPEVTWRRFQAWWRYGLANEPIETWLATSDDEQPIGCYLLWLPERENRQNAFLALSVALTRRRQGFGSALVGHAAGQAEQAGRTLLMADTRVGAPGSAFAQACRAQAGIEEVRRVLDLDPGLLTRLAGLRANAEQHAAGYSLRPWSGMTPDGLLEQASALYNAMEDAPHDASVEPLRWDADRLRKEEEQDMEAGMRRHSVAALANDTGEMAALTQVYVDPDQADWGYQGLTAVTRPHRGHRLGMLVKTAMLQRLSELEPRISAVETGNAAPNQYMIAVNEQLGFRVTDTFQNWQIEVAAARKLAG
jgi:RimJ/RimL family protein N-acetyltransferase